MHERERKKEKNNRKSMGQGRGGGWTTVGNRNTDFDLKVRRGRVRMYPRGFSISCHRYRKGQELRWFLSAAGLLRVFTGVSLLQFRAQ